MKQSILLPFFLLFSALAFAQTTRYFEFTTECGHGNWQDTAFVAATSDATVIASVLENLDKPFEERQFITGPIDYGSGGVNHNADHWFLWHFVPNEWSLADFAVEVCDGCPYTDVDADTAYWVGNLGQFCPWSGKPVRETSLVSAVDDPGFGEGELLFFPNPARQQVTLNLSATESVSVQIFNMMGQELALFQNARSQQALDLGPLQQGVYYLKFTKGDRTATRKLVKE